MQGGTQQKQQVVVGTPQANVRSLRNILLLLELPQCGIWPCTPWQLPARPRALSLEPTAAAMTSSLCRACSCLGCLLPLAVKLRLVAPSTALPRILRAPASGSEPPPDKGPHVQVGKQTQGACRHQQQQQQGQAAQPVTAASRWGAAAETARAGGAGR